jgi:hypothetical protein
MPYRDQISGETHASFLKSDYRWAQGQFTNRLYVQGSQLPLQRNHAVHGMQGEWILFIDDDMVFAPDAIGQLVASYHQLKEHIKEPVIVGGLCSRRYPPFQPTVFRALDMQEGPFRVIEDWGDEQYVECDATGAAFYLIEEDVFSAIMGGPMPSWEDRQKIKDPWPYYEWIGTMGEDMRFSLKARAAGCRIFVDTHIRIGHVASLVVGIEDFWRQVAIRSPEDEESVRLMNMSLDLPTLTADRAGELLRG